MNPLKVGDLVDHYRIGELAARGGMASVYRATDIETGAHVAIKIPHPEAEYDIQFFDRFQREADIGRDLDHPGIIKVLPKGRQSRVYMAMQWADGRLLREILNQQGTIAPERAVRIALSICDALEYIHANGVTHRDLKPENVMVDENDQIKLLDFGIAGKIHARRLTFGKLSHTIGTVDYISPEQVKGKRGDARSDLFALGVILYEMLTGKAPFEGPNPLAIMNDRLLNDPVPPRKLDRSISPQLQRIVRHAMQRDPEKRYANAKDVAYDLEHQDEVSLIETPISQEPKRQYSSWLQDVGFYAPLGLIPLLLFTLMFYIARHP